MYGGSPFDIRTNRTIKSYSLALRRVARGLGGHPRNIPLWRYDAPHPESIDWNDLGDHGTGRGHWIACTGLGARYLLARKH